MSDNEYYDMGNLNNTSSDSMLFLIHSYVNALHRDDVNSADKAMNEIKLKILLGK